jgi:2-oxoglutarate dehydrogenase E1 component
VLSPKSLLRHPLCVSKVEEFIDGTAFRELIDDDKAVVKDVKTVVLTSGKMYYQLLERRDKDKRTDVALLRLEQYYPLPQQQMEKVFKRYKAASTFVWVQEEPENFGAWSYLSRKLPHLNLDVICRKESSSSASGFVEQHERDQAELSARVFDK